MPAILFDDKTIPIYFHYNEMQDLNEYRASINVKFSIGADHSEHYQNEEIARLIICKLQQMANSIEGFQFFHDDHYIY